jgi:phage gp45-like
MEDYYTHRNSGHRFLIQKVVDDGPIQLIDADGMTDEKFTKIMRVSPHGFTSRSVKDAHMLALGLGGRRDLLVALGGEHPDKRIKNLRDGEAVLYDSEGNVIYAKTDKGIAVNAKTGEVSIIAQKDKVGITSQKDKVFVKPGDGKKVYLGGDGTDGTYAKVMTEDGPSVNVYAKVG